MVPGGTWQDGGMRKVQMENGLIRCSGGYCEMCPVKIQLKCEEQRMTPIERIEHIRQCLRRMKPTMGFELAAVAEIEKELVALELIFTRLGVMVEALSPKDPQRCPACPYPASLEAMTRDALNGDTCG